MTETLILRPAERARGLVVIPGDKSVSHRALIIASLTGGRCIIENLGTGADVHSTLNALRALGVEINMSHDDVNAVVMGTGGRYRKPDGPIDCGNSGTTMRLLAGILAAQPFETILTGDASLTHRPMRQIVDPLVHMGAEVETSVVGTAPVTIRGGKIRGIVHKPASASAQTKSCVLLAGLFAVGSTVYHEPLQTRDHTERLLEHLGGDDLIETDRIQRRIRVNGERLPLKPFDIVIPGDSSSAAFPIALGAVLPKSSITVPFVGLNAGRIAFFRHLQAMGASLVMTPDAHAARGTGGEPVGDISVQSSNLRNVPIGPDRIPAMIDELPLLAVIATQADQDWEIRGAARLREKETDRIATTVALLRAFGVEVEELEDGLRGAGKQKLKGGRIHSKGDHRIAMSAAVGAWCSTDITTIRGVQSVKISFPEFFRIMGGLIESKA